MSESLPNVIRREAVTRTYPIMIQTASKGVAWRSWVMVGKAMSTMLESNMAMNAPNVVLMRTTYLYAVGNFWGLYSSFG